ncbi:hypothetical protein IJ182_08390 [bacterium]|nr:hypothetical protein [bacterium]
MPIDALKAQEHRIKEITLKKRTPEMEMNNTLKGVLLNNHIKTASDNEISFDEIKDSLLINSDSGKYYTSVSDVKIPDNSESSFDTKKALKPLLIGTGVVIAGSVAVTSVLKHASKALSNTPSFEKLPDIAVNMNIKEEPQFALYRAIRNPSYRNILGAVGVILMSGITVAFKNFVEGSKDIWLKKQSADVEKNLQENLIAVETNSFSGKLKVVNELMNKNVKYFDEVINKKQQKSVVPKVFENFISFKGSDDTVSSKENGEKKKSKINKNLKYIALTAGVLTGAVIAGKVSLANLRKTAAYTNDFANGVAERTIDAINNISEKADKEDIPKIVELLQSICAKPEYIEQIGKKYNLSQSEIENILKDVEKSKNTIFANAPLALGGIPEKIQYYCYIDEDRGHLYNWILNPKNKFTKYIFLAFTSTSVGGYLFNQVMDATKQSAVLRENAKTDLDLRKRLVDVEIANFKAKKESAIQPLVDNFTKEANANQKTKEELKLLADNILTEIKNGPPYVYS